VADLSDPASPLQDAEMKIYNSSGCRNQYSPWGDGILTHLPFRSPDPTISFKDIQHPKLALLEMEVSARRYLSLIFLFLVGLK
jgi:hypothetical protein